MVLGWLLVARFVEPFVAQIDTDASTEFSTSLYHTNSPNLNRSHPINCPPNYSNFPNPP